MRRSTTFTEKDLMAMALAKVLDEPTDKKERRATVEAVVHRGISDGPFYAASRDTFTVVVTVVEENE